MASITISCEGTEQKYALETASVTLGRGLESDIRLKDIKASRRHCQIAKAGSGFQLIDLSSGNGTFINGVQVKQQALNPGDKIQIGATTITFNESGVPASVKAAAPAKTTQAAAAQSKVATAQLPVAVTRKMTARVEMAAKPTTQSVKKPGTQSIAKTGTQGIDKGATGAMKKTTQRPGGTSRSIGKASATQKFHQEARKPRSNPVVKILVGIGVIFVGIVAFILFGTSGGNESQIVSDKFKKLTSEAAALESERKYDDAIKKCKETLALIGNLDQYKTDAASVKAQIKELENNKKLMAEATGRFEAYEKKFEAMKEEEARDLWKEGKDLESAVKDAGFEWLPRLKVILERINKVLDTAQATNRRKEFQVIRNEIDEANKLGGTEPNYAGAVKAYAEYVKQQGADKAKAEQAVQSVNVKAKGEFVRLKARAERNADKAAGAADLEKVLPRFEGTDVEADFKKTLEALKAK